METEHICFHAELLWRELGQNMTVRPNCEIASGLDKKAKQLLLLAADATRKVVNKTVFANVFFSLARCHFCYFGPIYDLDLFRLADPGCMACFRNI